MRTARQNPKINFTIIKQHTATKLWDAETAATLLEQKPIKSGYQEVLLFSAALLWLACENKNRAKHTFTVGGEADPTAKTNPKTTHSISTGEPIPAIGLRYLEEGMT